MLRKSDFFNISHSKNLKTATFSGIIPRTGWSRSEKHQSNGGIMQKTYQSKSGGGYFFAGLLFALVLGGGGYWMLHKEKLSDVMTAIPRKTKTCE